MYIDWRESLFVSADTVEFRVPFGQFRGGELKLTFDRATARAFFEEGLRLLDAGYARPADYTPSRRARLVRAIAQIAQKACRNGESGAREWPALAALPFKESWKMVGEDYADQVAVALFADDAANEGGDP